MAESSAKLECPVCGNTSCTPLPRVGRKRLTPFTRYYFCDDCLCRFSMAFGQTHIDKYYRGTRRKHATKSALRLKENEAKAAQEQQPKAGGPVKPSRQKKPSHVPRPPPQPLPAIPPSPPAQPVRGVLGAGLPAFSEPEREADDSATSQESAAQTNTAHRETERIGKLTEQVAQLKDVIRKYSTQFASEKTELDRLLNAEKACHEENRTNWSTREHELIARVAELEAGGGVPTQDTPNTATDASAELMQAEARAMRKREQADWAEREKELTAQIAALEKQVQTREGTDQPTAAGDEEARPELAQLKVEMQAERDAHERDRAAWIEKEQELAEHLAKRDDQHRELLQAREQEIAQANAARDELEERMRVVQEKHDQEKAEWVRTEEALRHHIDGLETRCREIPGPQDKGEPELTAAMAEAEKQATAVQTAFEQERRQWAAREDELSARIAELERKNRTGTEALDTANQEIRRQKGLGKELRDEVQKLRSKAEPAPSAPASPRGGTPTPELPAAQQDMSRRLQQIKERAASTASRIEELRSMLGTTAAKPKPEPKPDADKSE